MPLQEASERRNLYRRFMSISRYDKGWITGPVYGATVLIPQVTGLVGVIKFSEQAMGEIVSTGNLEQTGIHLLAAVGSAALIVGASFLGVQAELGMKDGQRAEAEERDRVYSPRYTYKAS